MLPKVESPNPETIGLTTIVGVGTTLGMTFFVVATILRLPDAKREKWGKTGVFIGFGLGVAFYLVALVIQLLCRQ